jgi:hypothetical protein
MADDVIPLANSPFLQGMRQRTVDALKNPSPPQQAGGLGEIDPESLPQISPYLTVNTNPADALLASQNPDGFAGAMTNVRLPEFGGLAGKVARPVKKVADLAQHVPLQQDVTDPQGLGPSSIGEAVTSGMPHSWTEAALLAGAALLPEALPAVRAGAGDVLSQLPSRAAQIDALTPEVLPQLRTDITPQEVLAAAKAGPGKFGGFAAYMERNPQAGENLLDLSNPQPALPNRPAVPRYDPSLGRGRGPSARVVDAFNNPKVIQGFKDYIAKGAKDLPDNWYANDPIFKVYQEEWGPQAADKFFNQMGYQAATSTGSAVPDNIRTGSYYNYLAEQGIPFPEKPLPGYGSKYQVSHRDTALDLLTTGGVDALANPKRASFTENLVGNEDLLTADKHFVRLLGMLTEDPRWLKTSAKVSRGGQEVIVRPQEMFKNGELTMEQAQKDPQIWEERPNANEYKYMEDQFRHQIAKPMNYSVADAQGKAWVGAAEKTGMASPAATWGQLLRQRVQYTADRLNVDPQVILRKFVRGEIPLLEIGGAAAGLGALGSMGQPQNQGDGTNRPE